MPRAAFTGLATVDISYRVTAPPGPNQKVSAAAQQVSAGGPATNAAITFAFLGGQATLITAKGGHPLGAVIQQEVASFGIELEDLAAQRTEPPPVSSVMVLPDGNRSIVSANSRAFGALDGTPGIHRIAGCDLLLVDGHYLHTAIQIARAARESGMDVVLDGGSWKDGVGDLLHHVTLAICSHDFHPPGCRDETDVFDFLIAHRVPRIAITRGEAPVLFLDNGVKGEVPVPHIHPADTAGAGDVFHGAFCHRFAKTRDFSGSLEFAAHVAAFSCRYPGTRTWMADFGSVS